MNQFTPLSDDEKARIAELAPTHTQRQIAAIIGRGLNTVCSHCARTGIKTAGPTPFVPPSDVLDFITARYLDIPATDIGAMLKLSGTTIRKYIVRHIDPSYAPATWSKTQCDRRKAYIRANWRQYSDADMAEFLKVTPNTIQVTRSQMGLHRPRPIKPPRGKNFDRVTKQADHRGIGIATLAADYLASSAPVYRCNDKGRLDTRGDRWRYGWRQRRFGLQLGGC